MKYEIIGWTELGDRKFSYRRDIPEYVETLIIEEIRKNGYRFGGDMHESYCPVLNDGTYVSYSWRGWGRVMATAWGEFKGGTDYMLYYMDMLIPDELKKYPKDEQIDLRKIKSPEFLAETIIMHLADQPFKAMDEGSKTIELRLFDEKRKRICPGDYIVFVREGHEEDRIKTRVVNLWMNDSFKDLFESINDGDPRATPQTFGCPEGYKLEDIAKDMRKYYTEEEEKKYGVVAIEIEKAAHSCMTYLKLVKNEPPSDDLSQADEQFIDEFATAMEFGDNLSEFTNDWYVRPGGYYVCRNCRYKSDVNEMIRRTIDDFLGKEEEFKALLGKYGYTAYLGIVAHIVADSEIPSPILSLDDDIIAFLYKSGVKMDLDYYTHKE